MSAQPKSFALTGGLDQETPALTLPPGRAIAALNYESVHQGYQQTQGYERFDGRSAPSSARLFMATFIAGITELEEGETVTGLTSGATARVLDDATLTSGAWNGTGAGSVPLHLVTGAFQPGEALRVGGVTYATLGTARESTGIVAGVVVPEERDYLIEARDYLRALIQPVPGSGPVRGVIWYGGKLHAWRDNGGGTAGILHQSGAGGWTQPNLGRVVTYKEGDNEIVVGNVVVGATSGATGTVRSIVRDAETDWCRDAAGTMILDASLGDFVANEVIRVAGVDKAKAAGASTPMTFPPGGRYDFTIHNFYATLGFERIYGANGVGQAFEYDGDDVVIPISTGMPDDRPYFADAYKKHLFLTFEKGSLQHSDLGEPRAFTALFGAAELGAGHEITNVIGNAGSSLLVTTTDSLLILSGNDSSDWSFEPLSDNDAGAIRYTAQRIGQIIYLDLRGIRSVASTQTWGNFKTATYTRLIDTTLEAKRSAGIVPVASCVVKAKDQYLLFFSDGTGISIYFGRKAPEPFLFEYPFVAHCLHVAEIEGKERVFVGATDGYVYEINKGTSFDGEEVPAFLQLAFGNQGAPQTFKRYPKVLIDMVAGPEAEISVAAVFDYDRGYQPLRMEDLLAFEGGGAMWGDTQAADFVWTAPTVAQATAWLPGMGKSMSLVLFSRSVFMRSCIAQVATVYVAPRGNAR